MFAIYKYNILKDKTGSPFDFYLGTGYVSNRIKTWHKKQFSHVKIDRMKEEVILREYIHEGLWLREKI